MRTRASTTRSVAIRPTSPLATCSGVTGSPGRSERLELLPDGRVGLTLAHPWTDGTRALVFGPIEFLEKLAVLIPKPRINLLVYSGLC